MKMVAFTTALFLASSACAQIEGMLQPVYLRCEHRLNPLGIGDRSPNLSWQFQSAAGSTNRCLTQSAYQIRVGTHAGAADLWDSGKIFSRETVDIPYAGQPLSSGMQCFWQLRIWDQNGDASPWSATAQWSMGLLDPNDWAASWIGYDAAYDPNPQEPDRHAVFNTDGLDWVTFPSAVARCSFRTKVHLRTDDVMTNAAFALYADDVCGVFVNGQSATNLAVHWDATALINLTSLLRPGENALGLSATNFDGGTPSVIGQVVVQYGSGRTDHFRLDGSWKCAQTPPPGWSDTDFDDSGWAAASLTDSPAETPALNDVPRIPAPFLRKTFVTSQPVSRATAYVSALGAYELHLNGKKAGNDVLTPGWTEFSKRVYYQTYDVTELMQTGTNTIGAILGDGWYASVLAVKGQRCNYGGHPRFIAQLVLEFADGSNQAVITDDSWAASYGPILYGDLLMGSEYDAGREMPGWDTANFDDTGWSPVSTDTSFLPSSLFLQAAVTEASRGLETLGAVKLTQPNPGCYTFDFGQNMVGWVRLSLNANAGDRIVVRHGEMLNPDGTLYTANLRGATATDFYDVATNGVSTFEPRFTFHGFRYIEIRGLSSPPTLDSVTGIVVHSDMPATGSFNCSSPLLNQLYSNIVWSQKGNYFEVPTDCPQRDERMGWTGDTEFFIPTAVYNYDIQTFFRRHLVTLCEDSQESDGSYAHVSPDLGYGSGAPGWGDAGWICPYTIYRTYGDTNVIADHYDSMRAYGNFLSANANGYEIDSLGGFGDWLNLGGDASTQVIDTAFYAYYAQAMSEMASAIGRADDAENYASLHSNICSAFADFFNPDGSFVDGSSQSGYALAFTLGLVPDSLRDQAAEAFASTINQYNNHLATGFIGTPRLLPALHAAGRDDLAYTLLLQQTYPSWLYPVTLGATTTWERWDGWTPENGFQDSGMNSFNHYAFGAVGQYLYSAIGGINAASPGYRTILIQPVVQNGLAWANAKFNSPRGLISTAWSVTGTNLALQTIVPPNTTAQIWVPSCSADAVTESGVPATNSPGVAYLGFSNNCAIYAVGSGVYNWASFLPGAPIAPAPPAESDIVFLASQTNRPPLPPGDLLTNASTSVVMNTLTTGTENSSPVSVLFDGDIGKPGSTKGTFEIKGGSITFYLGPGLKNGGYTVTNLSTYTDWRDNGRENANYKVGYSSDGIVFVPLASVSYEPSAYPSADGTAGTCTSLAVPSLSGVKYLRWDFSAPQQNEGVGYAELAAFGHSSVTPGPVNLSAAPRGAGDFVMNIGGLATGQAYSIQSSTNLSQNLWTTETNFVASQNSIAFTNSIENIPTKLFRVIPVQ